MLSFIIGIIIGELIGSMIMCFLQINKDSN